MENNKDSMQVYYKFKSAKDFTCISIDWHYTTASDVIEYVLKNKCSGKRSKANYDNLTLTNADTNQVYLNGETLIPKNSFLIIRRAPKISCLPIVVNPPVQLEENELEDKVVPAKESIYDGPSVSLYPSESEWIEFWKEMSPSTVLVHDKDALPSKAEEDRKIKDVIDASALDWRQCHNSAVGFGAARGFGPGSMMGGRGGGRGFGQGGFSNQITTPPGYICHRCKVSGHFIQHCPTNGDPSFDIKRTKPSTGIPSSMSMSSPDSSYALPGSGVVVLKPNEAAVEKGVQAITSKRSVSHLPAELYCPLCRAVMNDAVLVSKCCFKSFCDKCIRDYIMTKSSCICGAINVLPDDLLPNKTLRNTIVRYLKSTNSNEPNDCSSSQPQDMEAAPGPQPEFPCSSASSNGVSLSPKSDKNTEVEEITEVAEPVEADNDALETLGKVTVGKGVEDSKAAHLCSSAPSKGVLLSTKSEGNTKAKETTEPVVPVEADNIAHETSGKVTVGKCVEDSEAAHAYSSTTSKEVVLSPKSEGNTKAEEITEPVDNFEQETLGKVTIGKGVEDLKAAHECAREPCPRMCPLTDEEMQEMQQKPISGEVQKKRKKFADMQQRPPQDFADMPVESSSYNPYWTCMQPEFNGFGQPYCGQKPFMGYGLGPMSISFGAAFDYNPYGAQVYMRPIPPARDLGKFGTGSNSGGGGGNPPTMSTGEFDAPKTTKKQKQDHEKSRGSKKVSKDRDFNRCMMANEDVTSVKSDLKLLAEGSAYDTELIRTSSKRKVKHSDYYEKHPPQPLKKVSSKSSIEETTSDWKHKASVLARLTFPELESPVFKKRKLGNYPAAVYESIHHRSHSRTSNGYHKDQCKTTVAVSKNNYYYADDHIYESSDDDRHFKRRSSRYERSPASAVVKGRHSSRGWREKGVTAANIGRLSVY